MKKTVAILLTGALALSAFTGCGAQNTATTAPAPETEKEVTEAAAPVAETEAVAEVATEEAEAEEEYDAPADFVQDQSGKLEFADYDEIISCLKPGQGYVTIQIGDDDNVLGVAEEVDPEEGTATSASFYVMKDGKPVEVGYVTANGMPLRAANGLVYGGGENGYESDFLNPDGNGIMVKDYVYKAEEDGKEVYGGFLRETNSFDEDQEFTGGEEELKALIAEREKAPVIVFTIVE